MLAHGMTLHDVTVSALKRLRHGLHTSTPLICYRLNFFPCLFKDPWTVGMTALKEVSLYNESPLSPVDSGDDNSQGYPPSSLSRVSLN
jgi:hypothetical protein